MRRSNRERQRSVHTHFEWEEEGGDRSLNLDSRVAEGEGDQVWDGVLTLGMTLAVQGDEGPVKGLSSMTPLAKKGSVHLSLSPVPDPVCTHLLALAQTRPR